MSRTSAVSDEAGLRRRRPAKRASANSSVNPQKATMILGSVAVANLLGNLAFHVVVARRVNVGTYGSVATLLSVGTGAAVVSAGVQFALARRVATGSTRLVAELRNGLQACVLPLAPAALAAALALPIAGYLRLHGATAVLATIVYFSLTILQAVPLGILVGIERFWSVALLNISGLILRLVLVVIFGRAATTTTGALVSSDVAVLFVFSASLVVLFSASRNRAADPAQRRAPEVSWLRTEGVLGALNGGMLWATWLLPIVFAEHDFAPAVAGRFVVGHMAAGAILFLAAPIATAFVPTIARGRRRTSVARGLTLTISVALACIAGLVVLGHPLFSLLYGPQFPPTRDLQAVLAISASITACATYLLWAGRASGRGNLALSTAAPAGLVIEVVLATATHRSPLVLAATPTISLVLGHLIGALRMRLNRGARDRVTPPVPRLPAGGVPAARRLGEEEIAPAGGLLARVSVGVMAHDEAATIGPCLKAILRESDRVSGVAEVIVVVSGADATAEVVREIAAADPRVTLISQPTRTGKAAAVNLFLDQASGEYCLLSSADVMFAPGSLALLVAPLTDPAVGMTGGAICPLNPTRGITNRLVHLLWQLHTEVALRDPKLGEAVAFRRVIGHIDECSRADEVSIEALIAAAGLELRFVPEAECFNNGPTRLVDYLTHRCRIHRAHLAIEQRDGYRAATLKVGSATRAATSVVRRQVGLLPLVLLAAVIECTARVAARMTHSVVGPPRSGVFNRIESAKRALELAGPPDLIESVLVMNSEPEPGSGGITGIS